MEVLIKVVELYSPYAGDIKWRAMCTTRAEVMCCVLLSMLKAVESGLSL